MELDEGEHVLIGDTPQQFADALVKAYRSRKLWTDMSTSGLERVLQTYTVAALQKPVEDMMRDINPRHTLWELHMKETRQVELEEELNTGDTPGIQEVTDGR
jgi:hypothetical protein